MARMLIVHSSRVAAAMIADLLRDQGHEVLNALTLADAEAALNHCDVDGMVVEVRHLPDANDTEIWTSLRQRPQFLRMAIVLIGTPDEEPSLLAGLAAGADGFLTTPVDRRCLEQQLNQALQSMRARTSEALEATSPWLVAPSVVPSEAATTYGQSAVDHGLHTRSESP